METITKRRTITLTDRPPVTIVEANWPVIAVALGHEDSARAQRPDYEGDSWAIRVRQHADGRAIVYATFDGATAWTGSESRSGGEVLTNRPSGAGIVSAIKRVGTEVGISDATIRECIADLPAEDLG